MGRLRGSSTARSAAFVLYAGAAFSVASPFARQARPAAPFVVALGRLLVASVVLVILDRGALASAVRALSWRQRATVALAGALLALHFACFLWGLDHTSYPAAVSLVSLEPLGVVVCAWALLGVAPSRAEQLGVGLATAGAIVVAQGAGEGEHRFIGDLVVVAAVVVFGLYLTVARALKDALPSRSYAALVYVSASVVMAVGTLLVPEAFRAPAWPLGTRSILAIVGLGLVPTVLGHTAVQTGSRTLPPAIVGLVSPAETLGGIAIGIAWMGAVPTVKELVGAAVILGGSAVAIVGPKGGRAGSGRDPEPPPLDV
jgi:drug/metabolite transporter (DMT)-like permease